MEFDAGESRQILPVQYTHGQVA